MLSARRRSAALAFVAALLLVGGLVFGLSAAPPAVLAPAPPGGRPRLAVLLLLDQLRADYLERWQELFGEDGFRRLMREGAWFRSCNYPYSDTFTAAGHASIVTGCCPDRHGIIGNEWYDRSGGKLVTSIGTSRYGPVPPRPQGAGKKSSGGASPELLLAPTVGDALKEATGGKARVVALSLKDRSAVLLGGRHPDGCYWFETDTGLFETSTYYRDALQPWVAQLHRDGVVNRWFGTAWERLRPDLDYVRWSGPDDAPGEGIAPLLGRTFPHLLGGKAAGPNGAYYKALYASPMGNELLLESARRAVAAENLGGRVPPDLLCLSFSCNDAVGHVWGPDSQEVLDTTLRTDRLIAELLRFLDDRVGKGKYVVALTADHGVCPLPEVSRSQGREAFRPMMDVLRRQAEDQLRTKFGGQTGERWIEASVEGWFWLDQRTIARHSLAQADVGAALAAWLGRQPGIQTALTRTDLLSGKSDAPLLARVRRSFYPARSGDVMIIPRPYSVLWTGSTGTGHGTPHPYDTHVPLLVSGPGIRAGQRRDPVTPLATAVILASALGIRPPASAEVPVPEGLLVQAEGSKANGSTK
jgi:hypothetical protein